MDAVVGGGYMIGGGTQSYFSKFRDGTLRFLPFDFIPEEQVWFGEAKNKRGWIPISEELSITDLSEWPPNRVLGAVDEFANCQQCHALKDVLATDYLPGKELKNYYALKLPIFGNSPYHPDVRIKGFGYQQNHLYSDCYVNGSMTCVDCHDPHSQGYRNINGEKLNGKFDNGQCTACHASKGLSPEKHSHHKPDSPGNRCTSCHMPFLQHKALGDRLRFARSDHTIPIPRPAFDASLARVRDFNTESRLK